MANLKSLPDINDLVRSAGEIPPYTCPFIDKVIRSVSDAEKNASKNTRHCDEDELRERLSEIENMLWDTDRTMEVIRSHNDTLRGLGEFWYEEYKQLHANCSDLIDEYIGLENEYMELVEIPLLHLIRNRIASKLQTIMRKVTARVKTFRSFAIIRP